MMTDERDELRMEMARTTRDLREATYLGRKKSGPMIPPLAAPERHWNKRCSWRTESAYTAPSLSRAPYPSDSPGHSRVEARHDTKEQSLETGVRDSFPVLKRFNAVLDS